MHAEVALIAQPRHCLLAQLLVMLLLETDPHRGLDSLAGVVTAVRPSRATMRNIRQNLFFALIYNAVGIPIAAGASTRSSACA